jgi:hypothetical protein
VHIVHSVQTDMAWGSMNGLAWGSIKGIACGSMKGIACAPANKPGDIPSNIKQADTANNATTPIRTLFLTIIISTCILLCDLFRRVHIKMVFEHAIENVLYYI